MKHGARFADYIQMSVSGVVATPITAPVPQPCPKTQSTLKTQSASASMAMHAKASMATGKLAGGQKRFGRSHAW